MTILIPVVAVSPLRQRLIDEMNIRRFGRETQRNYIRDVGRFATFLGRSPDTATAEEVRRFQVEQCELAIVADEDWPCHLAVRRDRMFKTRLTRHRFSAKSVAMTIEVFPDEINVLEACGRLVDFNAWEQTKIDPEGWLSNFSLAERPFALILLSRFTFLADHLVDQLFRSAFQNLSNVLFGETWPEFEAVRDGWRSFCSRALITLVQGENPNPSDSGWLFARKARQAVGIDQDQLREPREVVVALADGFSGPVVFVDDFVGSGEQFVRTWQRRYDLPGGGTASFKELAERSHANFFYCNAMTTEYGLKRIRRLVPSVTVSAGNIIPSRYSLADPDSLLWPKTIRNEGIALVKAIGHRLGYDADDGSEEDWRGFHKLGLAVAFQHSVPDANLPIFFTDRNGWRPLVQRL